MRSITIDKEELKASGPSVEPTTRELFDNISELVMFLESHLPPPVLHRVSEVLMPRLIYRVQSIWLSFAVPTDLAEMEALQSTVQSVIQFGDFLEKQKWPGKADFVSWAEDIPRFWLDKRRKATLNRVRLLLADGPIGGKTVERAETQFVSPKEGIFASAEAREDWNAGWSDDEGSVRLPLARTVRERPYDIEEDQDAVAWGINEVNDDEALSQMPESFHDQADDAWGWGDDEEAVEAPNVAKRTLPDPATEKNNGQLGPALVSEREITLRETFSITSLPMDILEIVTLTIMDADLMKSQYVKTAMGKLQLTSSLGIPNHQSHLLQQGSLIFHALCSPLIGLVQRLLILRIQVETCFFIMTACGLLNACKNCLRNKQRHRLTLSRIYRPSLHLEDALTGKKWSRSVLF